MTTVRTDREWILEALRKVAGGTSLKRYSPDTIREGGMCAQQVREAIEGALGIPANTWEVGVAAHEVRKARGGVVRYAADYEKAAVRLGLAKPAADMRRGDVLYWPYTARVRENGVWVAKAYGHTAQYLGNGLVLENSDANAEKLVERGAQQPLGRGTQIFVTPLALRGMPRTVIWPTSAIRDAERDLPRPAPVPAVPVATAHRVLLSQDGQDWQDVTGARVEIKDARRVVVNATEGGKTWVRLF